MRQRVVLVTGSGRGIGAEVASRCAEMGYAVCVNYLKNERTARQTFGRIQAFGHPSHLCQADVRVSHDVERLVRRTVSNLGGLDVLVNNAHTLFRPKNFQKLTWAEFQEQFEGTVRSAFLCTKVALPFLRKGISPAILNISSVTILQPQPGFVHRDTAKAALETFTRSVSIELATEGVRMNALSVGWTFTDQLKNVGNALLGSIERGIPLRRFAQPREIAEAALFLISPAASYLTGMVMPVDGGIRASIKSHTGGV